MSKSENRPPNTAAQRRLQLKSLLDAIGVICAAWDDAVSAAASRGYPSESPGPKSAQGIIKRDHNDPLHAHSMPGAKHKSSAFGDQTGNTAMRGEAADQWIFMVRRSLTLLLRLSIEDEHRTGRFYPPAQLESLRHAAEDVVSLWPKNISTLIERIHVLANTARREWPPTPKVGDRVGDVVVGERGDASEVCAECGKTIGANAADPLARIDGKPYHRQPCYNTINHRKRRARVHTSETRPQSS